MFLSMVVLDEEVFSDGRILQAIIPTGQNITVDDNEHHQGNLANWF